MKNIAITGAILAAGLLSACTMPESAISEYNGDSVRIQIDQSITFLPAEERAASKAKMLQQAHDICRRGHKKSAQYASQRHVKTSDYTGYYERFYLCLN